MPVAERPCNINSSGSNTQSGFSMFRRGRDASRQSSATLLGSSPAPSSDNVERRRSIRLLTFVAVALSITVLCIQLFSISTITSHTGMFFSPFRRPWALVIIACNRPWYLQPVLTQLLSLPKHQLSAVSLFLSQDGFDKGVEEVANHFKYEITHWKRPRSSNDETASTVNLAKHYKWTLDKLFFEEGFSHVIILEDDLLVSPDFLLYFQHTADIFDLDGRVMCISAHNDVGRKDVAVDPSRLFRTSFFPGLGWMLKDSLWRELSPIWPTDHFDWWLRSSAASRGRVCIAPEVNRVRHIGHFGVNCNKDKQGQPDHNVNLSVSALPSDSFYETDVPVEYTSLQSLLRPAYDRRISEMVARAKLLDPNDVELLQGLMNGTLPVSWGDSQHIFLTVFRNERDVKSLQKTIYLHELKEPRSFYRGILELNLPSNTKLLVANARTCVFLPPKLRYTQLVGIVPVVGEEGSSCNDACGAKHMSCVPDRFNDVSDGYLMELYFPCERNAWVLDSSSTNPRYHRWPMSSGDNALSSGLSEGTCFANSQKSECAAWQPGAMRLCPCSGIQTIGNRSELDRYGDNH